MANIFRQAYELVTTKTGDQMTDDELKLAGKAIAFMINTLPRSPIYDELPASSGLLRLAELAEEVNHGD